MEIVKKTYRFVRKTTNKVGNIRRKLEFEPYIIDLDVEGVQGKFFVGTDQAKKWYNPIKSYTKKEYEYVINNIDLKDKTILDCGAHHGHYSILLALGASKKCKLISVDPHPSNCALIEVNLRINDFCPNIRKCAVGSSKGSVKFNGKQNGKIGEGEIEVKCDTLSNIAPDAEVVKLDIEGQEYDLLPKSIERMDKVNDWIVEVHTNNAKHPDYIANILKKSGYKIYTFNREKNKVEEYRFGMSWNSNTTIFAHKK